MMLIGPDGRLVREYNGEIVKAQDIVDDVKKDSEQGRCGMRRAIIFGTSFAAILALAYLWPTARRFNGEWQRARRDVHRGSLLLHGPG